MSPDSAADKEKERFPMSDLTIDDRQQVIADLQAARSELVSRGRCRGRRVRVDGSVCALGAIAVAVVDQFDMLYLSGIERKPGIAEWSYQASNPRIRAAERELRKYVLGHVQDVAWFNDDRATTDQDVLNLFDKALAELGGLA